MTLVTIDAVVDISRHVVVLEVIGVIAAVTPGALEHGVVVRIRVACRAHIAGVTVGGRELRVLRMVEGGPAPRGRVVAVLAGGREELRLRRVAGIGRVVVVGLMTADARCRQRGVVVVDVAISADARRHRVRAGKREGCVVVVKRRVCPDSSIVAYLASGRESGCCVRWIIRAGVVLLVARVAERAVQSVVVVDVAVGAEPRGNRVGARQLETRRCVVEGTVGPEHSIVAGFARGGESRRNVVHRRKCVGVVILVARDASGAGQVVVVVYMAVGTLPRRRSMRACQCEPGTVVVKGRIQPGSRVVARIATLGEVRRDVIRIGRSLIILQVA